MTKATEIRKMSQEIIKFLDNEMPPPPARWRPVAGPETMDVLAALRNKLLETEPEEAADREVANVRNEAAAILSRCMPPAPHGRPGKTTGIAIGKVQSGKTTNFTTLAAMAADNGYPLVILLAGVSTALFSQSEERFGKALRLDSRGPLEQKWVRFSNPDLENLDQARAELAKWSNPRVPPPEKRVLLMLVMKNHARIRNLNSLLASLGDELQGTPVLVIDDEADQAGLNASVNKGRESTTYARILGLRRNLPWHTYVQYTATPQAPLLISIIDMLSPDFPVVLTPGGAYTGGERFFGETALDLVREIPLKELQKEEAEEELPPESLLQALRVFFIGVAAGRIVFQTHHKGPSNRSMMVHPSQRVDPHGKFSEWIKMTKRRWANELRDDGDPSHDSTVEEFREAWKDLQGTVDDLPSFEEILPTLDLRIDETVVMEMNAVGGKTPTPDWRTNYSHVLVGGQAMDRGFTVEGLTVTYMPRGVGTGNADTVQQRARFFGYKRDYLGYCRVYLEPEANSLFRSYVEHEADMHVQMRRIMVEGKSLKEWKRNFLLDPRLKPTRSAVMKDPIMRENFANTWWNPKGPHDGDEAIGNNQRAFEEFIGSHDWKVLKPDPKWTDEQVARTCRGLSLKTVEETFLSRLEMPRSHDSIKFTALLLQLTRNLEKKGGDALLCDIFEMSSGASRKRTLDDETEGIPNLFQGKNPGTNYPGDREIKTDGRVNIQLHWVDVVDSGGMTKRRVPVAAVWVPEELSTNMVLQYAEQA